MGRDRKGYIYVLSNPSMPGLLKIGRSASGGKSRAKDIYQTGVPTPFIVEFEVLCDDCVAAEVAVHEYLKDRRLSSSREFFEVNVFVAKRAVLMVVAAEFHHELIHVWMARAWRDLLGVAEHVGLDQDELCWAIPYIEPEHLKQALDRFGPIDIPDDARIRVGDVH